VAQVLELLDQVRRRFQLAMLFITHDLRVAAQVCDRIAVMYQGEVVEQGPAADVFSRPSHAYTRPCSTPPPAAIGNSASSTRVTAGPAGAGAAGHTGWDMSQEEAVRR
jgi:peptide/nickel transport system ATP-binding protein